MSTKIFMRVFISLLVLSTFAFASIGRITALSGDVSVQRGAKTQKATSNFQLDEKDTIKSSAGATAQIVFNDKTVITVGSNTVFKIEEYLFNDKAQSVRFNVGEGSFKTITGKIAKIAPEKFKVETKTATIGIRGTIFLGSVDKGGALTVACTKGAIVVMPTVAPGAPPPPPVVVNQGQITKADNKGVEPPRAYTPTDMKNLEKTLTTDKKAQSESSGGGEQKQASQQQTTQESQQAQQQAPLTETEAPRIATAIAPPTAPKVENIVSNIGSVVGAIVTQQTTEDVNKAIEEILIALPPTYPPFDGGDGGIQPPPDIYVPVDYKAMIDAMQITPYADLPTSGMYTYGSIDGSQISSMGGGSGYANFYTKNMFYSHLGVENNKIVSSYGFGSITDDNNNSKITIGSYEYQGATPITYSETGNFRRPDSYGPGANYAKIVDGDGKASYLYGYSIDPNVATTYSTNYTPSIYLAQGSMMGFAMSKTDFSNNLFSATSGESIGVDSGLSMYWNPSTGALNAGGSVLPSSMMPSGSAVDGFMMSEDAFGFRLDSSGTVGHLITVADGLYGTVQSDYSSWGYWQADTNATHVNFGFWVAGAKTLTSELDTLVTNNQTYTYAGNVMGAVLPTAAYGAVDPIDPLNGNSVNLSINFGAAKAISGSIAFKTMSGASWNMGINANSTSGTSLITPASSSFRVYSDGGNPFSGTGGASAIEGGLVEGYFYGPNAKSIGGTFNADTASQSAKGVFKATR